jgi:hypothetical protein
MPNGRHFSAGRDDHSGHGQYLFSKLALHLVRVFGHQREPQETPQASPTFALRMLSQQENVAAANRDEGLVDIRDLRSRA